MSLMSLAFTSMSLLSIRMKTGRISMYGRRSWTQGTHRAQAAAPYRAGRAGEPGRRLLNDLDAYRASAWRQDEPLEIVATDWMREVFEPTVRMIPPEYHNQIEPAQFFHEVLTHRWYLAEAAGMTSDGRRGRAILKSISPIIE